MKKIWYKWPQGYIKYYLPWYVIFWRLLFAPLLLLGMAMIYVYYLLTQGYDAAKSELQNLVEG